MAINPNILLQGRGVDLGSTIGNVLSNVGRFDQLQQNRELAQQQQNQARMKSVSIFGAQVAPMLQSGDIEGARATANKRLAELKKRGIDTTETEQFIELLNTNPELAAQRANQAVQIGQKLGFFAVGQGATGKQRELEQFRNLPEGTDQEKRFKTQFGQAIGAISKLRTTEEKLDLARGKADIKTGQKVSEVEALEKTITGKQDIQLKKINIDETKIKNLELRQQAIDSKNVRRGEATNAADIVSTLMDGDLFSSAFGRFNNAPPEGLRSQANLDARAQVDQVLSLLSLESREKLKGQGTITDSEMRTLEKSSTLLANPLISDELARKELRRVRRIFEDAADRNILRRTSIESQQSQGQVFRFDDQGNLIQ